MLKFLSIIAIVVIVLAVFFAVAYLCSQALQKESILIDVNKGLNIKIAHISDLHFPYNGISTDEISDILNENKPDVIVLTGDIVDGSVDRQNIDKIGTFFKNIAQISPCYAVIGNHEIGLDDLDYYVEFTKKCGINVLLNDTVFFYKNGKRVALCGLSDAYKYNAEVVNNYNQINNTDLKILLAHRPELISQYLKSSKQPDVIFCGHAHGGFFRIGKLALYSPNQGLFPKYTSGLYPIESSYLVVSRGLGNSGIDYRGFNKYHLIFANIQ